VERERRGRSPCGTRGRPAKRFYFGTQGIIGGERGETSDIRARGNFWLGRTKGERSAENYLGMGSKSFDICRRLVFGKNTWEIKALGIRVR